MISLSSRLEMTTQAASVKSHPKIMAHFETTWLVGQYKLYVYFAPFSNNYTASAGKDETRPCQNLSSLCDDSWPHFVAKLWPKIVDAGLVKEEYSDQSDASSSDTYSDQDWTRSSTGRQSGD